MYFVEKVLKQKAEEIPTPTDFCVNDSASEVSITVGNLEKKDGKGISKDKITEEKELEFKSSIEYNQKLKSIVKEYERTVGEIEINVDRVELNSISKESTTLDKIEEESKIIKEELDNINKNNSEKNIEYNDDSKIEKINVESINNYNQSEFMPDEVANEVLDDIQEKIDDDVELENQNEQGDNMDLRVNHEELKNFYDNSNNESDYLKEKIDFWLKKIEELKVIWQGNAAEEFFQNAESYFERMKLIPEFYDSVNNFVIKANREYKDTDKESKKNFQKVAKEWDDKNV